MCFVSDNPTPINNFRAAPIKLRVTYSDRYSYSSASTYPLPVRNLIHLLDKFTFKLPPWHALASFAHKPNLVGYIPATHVPTLSKGHKFNNDILTQFVE